MRAHAGRVHGQARARRRLRRQRRPGLLRRASTSTTSPTPAGCYGAALLFVRWSRRGRPAGRPRRDRVLAWGRIAAEAEERLKALSLYDVKAALDDAIARAPGEW